MSFKSGVLLLTLDDAVHVATRCFGADEIIARQEFEQKCYIPCSDYEKGFYDGLAKGRDIIEDTMKEDLHERAMEDSISRQAAIDACHNYEDGKDAYAYGYVVEERLKELPSAEPKTGKWKFTKFHSWECSQCKKNPTKGLGYVQSKDELFDFCPNCGADMRGEE